MNKTAHCGFMAGVKHFQARLAPVASKTTVTYVRDYPEKEGDGPSNRELAAIFKRPGGGQPDIGLTMLGAGSKYRETYKQLSKKQMLQARQEKPDFDFNG